MDTTLHHTQDPTQREKFSLLHISIKTSGEDVQTEKPDVWNKLPKAHGKWKVRNHALSGTM
jgi:hypothetical protein